MTKRQTIVEMLRRYNEAQEPPGRCGIAGSGDGVALMPVTWNASYVVLERTLRRMRLERQCWYWHVRERYVDASSVLLEVPVTKRNRQVRVLTPPNAELIAGAPAIGARTTVVRVSRWDRRVREEDVRLGLDWLEAAFPGTPYLPLEYVDPERAAA